jgi:transcriptional regulator with XRE-family HTH domain
MQGEHVVANQFGKNLYRCRRGRGLTRTTLAGQTKLTVAAIGRLERGEQRPSVGVLVRLAGALEIPLRTMRMWRAPPADVGAQFGENLRRCRKEGGLSQEETAFRAGLARTEISLLERGQRVPRVDTAARLADAVGVSTAELLEGIEWTIDGGRQSERSRRRARSRRGDRS